MLSFLIALPFKLRFERSDIMYIPIDLVAILLRVLAVSVGLCYDVQGLECRRSEPRSFKECSQTRFCHIVFESIVKARDVEAQSRRLHAHEQSKTAMKMYPNGESAQ